MIVRDVMGPLQASVAANASVADVARVLLDNKVNGVPVVSGTALVGLVTRRDVVSKHAHVHLPVYVGLLGYVAPFELPGSRDDVEKALAVTAAELMETDVVTIDAGADVDDAASLMVDKGIDPIPVLDHGQLAGMISMGDIIRLVLTEEGDATTP